MAIPEEPFMLQLFGLKSDAYQKITEEIPHGIRYSLTLHDRHGDVLWVLTTRML